MVVCDKYEQICFNVKFILIKTCTFCNMNNYKILIYEFIFKSERKTNLITVGKKKEKERKST